jgi:autotransporter-associated beta strand protein
VANFTLLISATGIFTRSFDRIRLRLRSVSDSWWRGCAEIDAFFPVTGRYQALYLALRTVSSNLSSANNATLIAEGGLGGGTGGIVFFFENSSGGTARIEIFGNGTLDISSHFAPGVTVGSIEGSGVVSLGSNKLTVGGNNLSTTFSGLIDDQGFGGSLTKVGSGKLTLSRANTYTGGTAISAGTLFVTNSVGSGTGRGAMQVNAGKLGGQNIWDGACRNRKWCWSVSHPWNNDGYSRHSYHPENADVQGRPDLSLRVQEQ